MTEGVGNPCIHSASLRWSADVFFRNNTSVDHRRATELFIERDVAQCLKRGAVCQYRCLPCGFESRLVRDFQRNILFLPSQYWHIVSMFCHWARHLTIKCLTWLGWKWVPGTTEMTMCMISSIRRKVCRTVALLMLRWHTDEYLFNFTPEPRTKTDKELGLPSVICPKMYNVSNIGSTSRFYWGQGKVYFSTSTDIQSRYGELM